MASSDNFTKYDDALTAILVNEKSIVGFLSTIFNFLARRTDFYYVPEDSNEQMGFPPGVAEELVLKVLRKCDPKTWDEFEDDKNSADVANDIMCDTVVQEVEVVAENDTEAQSQDENYAENPKTNASANLVSQQTECESVAESSSDQSLDVDRAPPIIPTQKNSETYNGAEREKYSWSQTIMELDVTIKLPPDIKSSKDVKVNINNGDLSVMCCNGVIIKDTLLYKIKAIESFWSISEGKLLIHLEKVQERWWNKLLTSEEEIDLSKIDCSRPLYELPDDHIAKVHELQWNQERKMRGLPTSDQIRKIEVLKKAWNAEGSPFKGQEFDPSVLEP